MKNFNSTMADDYHTSQSNLAQSEPQQQQQQHQQQQQQQQQQHQRAQNQSGGGSRMIVDEMSQDLQYLAHDAPLDGGESTFGAYSQLGGGSQHGLSTSQRDLDSGSPIPGGQQHQQQQLIMEQQSMGYGQTSGVGNLPEQHLLLRDDDLLDLDGDRQQRIHNHQQQQQRDSMGSPTSGYVHNEQALEQLAPDNVDIQRPLQQAGFGEQIFSTQHSTQEFQSRSPEDENQYEENSNQQQQQQQQHQQQLESSANLKPLRPFLVSFMVDARGGAMRGCRHSGVRIIIPPASAPMPMRITCRYLRRERLVHPPPLMEGEACASKIMEVGPAGAKFLGPVLIEVPHFASLRGKEREIIILRSDSGEVWREHIVESDDKLIESIIRSAEAANLEQSNQQQQENVRPQSAMGFDGASSDGGERRLTRIVTNEFPQYFAIISRIRQQVHTVGPQGQTVDSQVVPRVQTTFTEGALTKRIKIGLQPKSSSKTQQAAQQQQQPTSLDDSQLDSIISSSQQQQDSMLDARPGSPEAAVSGDRPGSPQSNQSRGSQAGTRPGSAAKRRSRFLACFGAGQGSVDLLNSATDESSAGGDSPREKRFRLEGSDGETHGSPSPNGSLSGTNLQQLVPEDYYIEKELPLILNVEPKTYGKRLASSSAQTDNKLSANGFLSTSARTPKKRGGLLRKRRNKTQMTIHCEAPTATSAGSATTRPKSVQLEDSASNLASPEEAAQTEAKLNGLDSASIIQDVFTSDDHKWRTCTIQTDSDSVTVNYVTIAGGGEAKAPAAATKSTGTGTQDDGYVSGSGDINRQSSFGKGLFGLSSAFGGADKHQASQLAALSDQPEEAESKKSRKQRAKANKKLLAKSKSKSQDSQTEESTKQQQVSPDETKALASQQSTVNLDHSIELQPISISTSISAGDSLTGTIAEDNSGSKGKTIDQTTAEQQVTSGERDDIELTRSTSPSSSKELKLKLKLERQEKQKREKEEKRLQKEQEEAAAKEEKLRKKAEKEAKKAEQKAQKLAKKAAGRAASPTTGEAASEQVAESDGKTKTTSVKFASNIVESARGLISSTSTDDHSSSSTQASPKLSESRAPIEEQQLDSLQQVIESEKEPQKQENGHDMVELSLNDQQQLPSAPIVDESLIILSDSEDPSKSIEVETTEQQQQHLKPILKQQPSVQSYGSGEEFASEIVIGEPKTIVTSEDGKLVSEASDEAVKAADALKKAIESPTDSASSKKEAKELKERLKREAKAQAEEAKKAEKEAKEAAKKAAKELAEAKKREEEEAKRKAKEAKAEEKRLAKAEKDRLAQEAKAQAEEAKKAEKEAKEAAKKAKLDLSFKLPSFGSKSKSSGSSSSSPVKQDESLGEKSEPVASTGSVSLTLDAPKVEESIEEVVQVLDTPKEVDESKLADKVDEAIETIAADGTRIIEEESKLISEEPTSTVETITHELETSSVKSPEVESEESKKDGKKSKKAPKEKKVKKEKVKKEKKAAAKSTDVSEIESPSEQTQAKSSSSKSSFFSRLFSSGKKSADKKKKETEDALDSAAEKLEDNVESISKTAKKMPPLIVSEMYPSDPNNADGEMILEVNVPGNLIEGQRMVGEQQQQQQQQPVEEEIANTVSSKQQNASQASDFSPTLPASTTIDETLKSQQHEDQEATLLNISQMINSDDNLEDEDATENVVSQAQDDYDLTVSQSPTGMKELNKRSDLNVEGDGRVSPAPSREELEEVADSMARETLEAAVASGSKLALDGSDKKKTVKKNKDELREEKARKELELKLEKEAKKRAKEEEKLKKKQAKEAQVEAKRAEKEANKRAKEEAKEAKRLADLAKKQAKQDQKKAKKEAKALKGGEKLAVGAVPAGSAATEPAASGEQVVEPEAEVEDGMTPVNTETETEKIVEEVVDEDGTVTRTTKTIETKYVTMRSEELRTAERKDMPADEYEREIEHQRVRRSSSSSTSVSVSKSDKVLEKRIEQQQQQEAPHERRLIVVGPYEHAELEAIQSTPSFFGEALPEEIPAELSAKKAMKKRIKLNNKLIKRAHKLAKVEASNAKKGRGRAETEIAVCDEAAREARKQLKRALKEAKRAGKEAAKEHKRMDKMDKKLAKNQRKIEKRQAKLDKQAAKLAKKLAKRAEKEAKKEAKRNKKLERKSSQKSQTSGSRKSIKLEDIGRPVLQKSSSKASIGAGTSSQMALPADNEMQVEVSLEGGAGMQMPANLVMQSEERHEEPQIIHTITRHTIDETPDGKVNEQFSEQVLTGEEAREASNRMQRHSNQFSGDEDDDDSFDDNEAEEEIDVVNDLPQIVDKLAHKSQQPQAE